MSWCDRALEELQAGREVAIRPRGNSMLPRIASGQSVRPLGPEEKLKRGDIVLVRVKGRWYLHFVGAVSGERCRIENARGRVNGWVAHISIAGRLISG